MAKRGKKRSMNTLMTTGPGKGRGRKRGKKMRG